MRIELGTAPDGAERWAEIMPVEEMPAKVRRRVRAVIEFEAGEDGPRLAGNGGIADEMKTVLIASIITSWSFSQPVTTESVEDLPVTVYDQLAEAAEPHEAALNFSRASKDGTSSSG